MPADAYYRRYAKRTGISDADGFAAPFSGDEHSWANMLKEGATTCWEAWGKDQKWNTSLCHPWASAPIIVLIEDAIGIRPSEPGFAAITQTPHAPAEWGDIHLTFGTVRGKITADRRAGVWTLRIGEAD